MSTVTPDKSDEPSDRYSDEVSLAEYMVVLWRHRFALLGLALAGGLIALGLSLVVSPVYEATSKLVVSPSKIGNEEVQQVSLGTYVAMVNNQSLVREAINELGLNRPPHNLAVADVIGRRLTVNAVRETYVIEVTARFEDPVVAANLANRLSDKAVQLARRLNQEDTVSARDTIKQQLDETAKGMADADRRLDTYRQEAGVESLKKDVEALLDQRARQLALGVAAAAQQARIATLTQELAKQVPVRSTRRSTQAARGEGAVALRDEVLDPYANPVHEYLEQQLAESRTRLAGIERESASIRRALAPGSPGDRKLAELQAKEAEVARLSLQAEQARSVYKVISTRYEEARLQVAGRSPQLQVIDPAMPPERPVSPRVARNTVMGALLTLILASAALLLYAALSGDLRRVR